MKQKLLLKSVKNLLFLSVFSFVMLFSQIESIAQTVTTNTQSTNNGFFYSFWNDNTQGSASMTLGAAGNYTTTWSNVGNFTAGKGWATGKADRTICFSGSFDGGSNGFLAVYGWTKNPLIEYYVCESHGSWTPPGNTSDIVKKGTYTCDGSEYTIYTATRTNQPSIIGTATFQQFWSIRSKTRSSGTVTFASHVAAWKAAGMNMGTTWDYQIMESEGYHSSGSSNITVSECSAPTGPTVSITVPADNTTFALGTSVLLTALPTLTSGTVTKVEFFNGTTLLGTATASPYSYTWTKPAVGTYSITAKVTDNSAKTATSTAITVKVIDPFKIYKTPTAITIDGTPDAIWSNASVLPASAAKLLSGTVTNTADLSGTFKALWDNTYLYVYADVTDESLKNESTNAYDDDGIEVYIDADNAKATAYDANDVQYSFNWDDGTTIGTIPAAYSKTGISYSAVNKTGGYIIEARIPWATLQATPTIGKVLGVDFMINDDDDGTTRDAKLSWNAATDDAWDDASLFGIAVLGDVLANPCTTPSAPTVVSPVTYIVGSTATALTATGTNLLWYTTATGGTGSVTAPTPVTTATGTTNYYVSQTVNTCESPRALIAVVVSPITQTVSLKAGWNLVGCPITGSTAVASALASIWSKVETVKNMDVFYSTANAATINSLKTVEWGKGYFVKVTSPCVLDWIAK